MESNYFTQALQGKLFHTNKMGLMDGCFLKSIEIKVGEIVSIVSPLHNKYTYKYIYIHIYAYAYAYIHISVQECIEIQTATLWIYHVHPTRKKRADKRLNLTSQ